MPVVGGIGLMINIEALRVGDQNGQAIEIIGEPDPTSGGFLARSFDNLGNWEVTQVTVATAGPPAKRQPNWGPSTGPRSIDADGQRHR
jgi:hypothetical protein